MSAAISPSSRRNSCGCVRLSRRRARLCCTNGCAMTVTPFTLIYKSRREKIKITGLEVRHFDAEVELDVVRLAALIEHREKIGDVVTFLIFDEVGVADVS